MNFFGRVVGRVVSNAKSDVLQTVASSVLTFGLLAAGKSIYGLFSPVAPEPNLESENTHNNETPRSPSS